MKPVTVLLNDGHKNRLRIYAIKEINLPIITFHSSLTEINESNFFCLRLIRPTEQAHTYNEKPSLDSSQK